VNLDLADRVMAELPKRDEPATEHKPARRKIGPGTRRQVAQAIHKLMAMAVYPGKYIPGSPIPKGWLPKPAKRKAMSCLFPDEDAKLMACKKVPLLQRMVFGVYAREGMRRSELLQLTWGSIDLKRGTLDLEKNKTDDPRSWAMDPGVARALSIWREHFATKVEDRDLVFSENGKMLVEDHLALKLRNALGKAGIDRSQLTEQSAHRQRLRLHDLRATFVTVNLALGKSETWVMDRTGHQSSAQLQRYKRQVRQWAQQDLGPLAPLDEAIPELAEKTRKTRNRKGGNGQGGIVKETSKPDRTSSQTTSTAREPRAKNARKDVLQGSTQGFRFQRREACGFKSRLVHKVEIVGDSGRGGDAHRNFGPGRGPPCGPP